MIVDEVPRRIGISAACGVRTSAPALIEQQHVIQRGIEQAAMIRAKFRRPGPP